MKKLKAFEIETEFINAPKCCVIAESEGTARNIFEEEYPYAKIKSIKFRCDFVLIQQKKE